MNSLTHITTFYSFKGGVGRTLMLANVGAVLAKGGRRVLLWDLDVEAPGMHMIPSLTPAPLPAKGFLEWLMDWQQKHKMGKLDQPALDSLFKLVRPVPKIDRLSILPAFGDKADSAGLYQDIQWREFLVKDPDRGLELFRTLLAFLGQRGAYDHILLDARTGITDLGGFMTALLPHATVLVGSYGAQNLAGILRVYQALQPAVENRIPEREPLAALHRLIVISPVPDDQEERHALRKEAWDKAFPAGKQETWVEIPFESSLLFSEEILSLTAPDSPVAKRYEEVASHIDDLLEALYETRERIEQVEDMHPEKVDRAYGDMRKKEGLRFEDRVSRLLSLLGYKVEREQYVDGNRVDLIARKQSGLRAECYLVECKEHKRPVGKDVIEKLGLWLQGKEARDMSAEGMVVAPRFSPAAMTFAKSSGMLTYTPDDLERTLFDFGPYLSRLCRGFEESPLARTYVEQRVFREEAPDCKDGTPLLPHGLDWAAGKGRRLWLLLGDYGTGKTAFFKRFSYELARRNLDRSSDDPPLPIPVAVDLKDFPNAISLEGLLQEHFRTFADWHGNPEILLHLLASGRVVLLLDAFDEMGTAAAGRSVEEQFRMLVRPTLQADQPAGGRVLITCRTHFFRDQQYVKDVCSGVADDLISRDSSLGRVARSFDAAIDEILLFNEEQIHQFLQNHLPQHTVRKAEDFIRSTYDLPSLAPRPVLLEMIVGALPGLMKSGESLTPAGLYHRYTSQWLEDRSGGQLLTNPQQRKRLLEILALELRGRPMNRIHHRELLEILEKLPPERLAGLDFDRVDLELRTAAFLTRTNDGFYGFSHRSFLEFFYARHLLRSLQDDPKDFAAALDTIAITKECSGFLADMVESETAGDTLQEKIRQLLQSPYRPRISENALRIAYHMADAAVQRNGAKALGSGALARVMKRFVPPKAQLSGAQLQGEMLRGAWLKEADLSGARLGRAHLDDAYLESASFVGASLADCRMHNVKAKRANFSHASLQLAEAKGGDFRYAEFQSADLIAAIFVETDCRNASFAEANCHAARFAKALLRDTRWNGAVTTSMTCPDAKPPAAGTDCPRKPQPFLNLGHGDLVADAEFSPDGKKIVTAGEDYSARIWDISTGQEVRRLEGHGGSVNSAVFSSNGKTVLTASDDKTARLWDVRTGRKVRRLEGHGGSVNSAVFSSNGKTVLTASDDKTARLWDVRTGREVRRLEGHGSMVNSAVFSTDGQLVLTASEDKTARLWDAKTGKELHRFEGRRDVLRSAVFSPDGKTVLTATTENTSQIWDISTGKELRSFKGHGDMVRSAVFSPDGKTVLTGSDDKTARLWDAETGQEIRRFEGHWGSVWSAVFSSDGKTVLTAGADKTARIWDINTGQEIRRLEGHGGFINSAVYFIDGKAVITTCEDKTARLWDAKIGQEVRRFEGHGGSVCSAVFSSDGKTILTASADMTARIWDAKTGHEICRLEGHRDWVSSAVFSPDGKTALTASYDATARIWDVKTGKEIRRFEGHGDGLRSAAFSPDGKTVLTASDDITARIWDAKTGKEIRRFEGHGHWVSSAVFFPDGKTVLTASHDATARLWNVKTGQEIRRFEGHGDWVSSAVFSPDGETVLTASADITARIWDKKTGKEIRRFKGQGHWVMSAVFSPNGEAVLTANDDKTARIWDARTGDTILILAHFENGWLSLDAQGKYRGDANGIRSLSYVDSVEESLLPTLWAAEDLPRMAADYKE